MTTTDPGGTSVRADWYPDPLDAGSIRYWDGVQWTVHTAPAPTAASSAQAPVAPASVVADLVPAPADPSVAPTPVAAPARDPRSRKRIVAWISAAAGLIALIGVGTITVNTLNSGPRSATSVVQTYLDAIAAGDAERANKLVDPGVADFGRSLLTDEVLRAADGLISVQSVRLLDTSATGATVEASLALDGEPFTHRFSLRKGANEFLFLDSWQLKDAFVIPVTVMPDGSGDAKLGEIAIPAGTHWMYPASYTFRTAETAYFERGTQQVALTAGPPSKQPTVQPQQNPTPALSAAVLSAVQKRVEACVLVPTNMDDACPAAARNTDLAAFHVESYPRELASLTGEWFESEAATIVTQGNARGGYTPPERKTTFSVSGTIRWENGEPVFEFNAQ